MQKVIGVIGIDRYYSRRRRIVGVVSLAAGVVFFLSLFMYARQTGAETIISSPSMLMDVVGILLVIWFFLSLFSKIFMVMGLSSFPLSASLLVSYVLLVVFAFVFLFVTADPGSPANVWKGLSCAMLYTWLGVDLIELLSMW